MLQTAVADVLTELRLLAAAASTRSAPTGAGREDHVAMGPAAARKALRAARDLGYVAAVELVCGAEAIEHHRPLRSSPAIEQAIATVRQAVPRLTADRPLSADVERIAELVRKGKFSAS
jgi:histidine ammonia-lyase